MGKHRSQLKILLLQIRDDQVTCLEELNEFVRFSGLGVEQFELLNGFKTPEFEPTCIEGYDALFIGGSSDASVTQPDRYPFVEDSKRLVLYCLKEEIPVFASCFGFQVAVEALGGRVILDKENMEMGTYRLTLTEAAASDRLFQDVPKEFWAVSGHKERAISLPQEAILLAFSERCPYHAFKIANKPFYGFQFHPEVDPLDLTARITRYQSRYLDSSEMLAEILKDLKETTIANQLIQKFVDRILLS
ncbi:type 1 glutamine amidotransferase [Leptothermofonsia sp. ETS-13]|uniref:type 1 glutamine amidotransferase n=1 Tax=Leptothermofonsia sp. ETS-13 TaxID=3035696 RepID=UPI003B9FA915